MDGSIGTRVQETHCTIVGNPPKRPRIASVDHVKTYKGLCPKGLIKPFKDLIRPLKGLIRPLKGIIRPLKGLIVQPACHG